MAFVLLETRTLFDRGGGAEAGTGLFVGQAMGVRNSSVFWRLISVALVMLAHLLAGWIIQSIRTATPIWNEAEAILVTNVPSSAAPQPDLENPPARSEATSKNTTPPKSDEWSISRIASVRQTTSTETAVTASTSSQSGSGSAPGSPGYDPYAGVAPLRYADGIPTMPVGAAQASQGLPAELSLGPATLNRLTLALQKRAGAETGIADLRAAVSSDGSVIRVEILSTTLSDRVRILLIDEARKLRFGPGPERIIRGSVQLG